MNRKIKALALLHIMLGGGGIVVCFVAYLCWIKLASDAHSLRTAHTLGQMMFMLSMFILLPSLVCGVGLLLEKAWSRVVTIGWSMFLLLVIPIGTLLGGYGLSALLRGDAPPKTPPRSEVPSHVSGPQYPIGRHAGVLLSLAAVGAGFIVLIRTGFWLSGDRVPTEVSSVFPEAIALLVLVVIATVMIVSRGGFVRFSGRAPSSSYQATYPPSAEIAAQRASFAETQFGWMNELPAGRVSSEPAASVKRSEHWSKAKIEYQDDPSALATCVHLRVVERNMRDSGIDVRLDYGMHSKALCRIDHAAFARLFGGDIAALYEERHEIDRSYLDPKSALFWCPTCQSRLTVVHPEAANAHTRWFPSSAAS